MNPQKLIHIGGYVKFFYLGSQLGKVEIIYDKTVSVRFKIAGVERTIKVLISECEVVS